jgi:hypothetical protein
MSKKDYVLIAAILAETRNVEPTSRRLLAEEFATVLGMHNPAFDRFRFLEAALKYD